MIAVVDVAVQAANPQAPLYPWRAFLNSPSSVRVRNVPRKIGAWVIDAVSVQATYPDGNALNVPATLVGGIWVATVQGCDTTGSGFYAVYASGLDEQGNPVQGYCLGKGDIEILEDSGEISPSSPTRFVTLLSGETESPADGNLYPTEDGYAIWQNGEAHGLGTSFAEVSAYVDSQVSSKADLSALEPLQAEIDSISASTSYPLVSPLSSMAEDFIATSITGNPLPEGAELRVIFDDINAWLLQIDRDGSGWFLLAAKYDSTGQETSMIFDDVKIWEDVWEYIGLDPAECPEGGYRLGDVTMAKPV